MGRREGANSARQVPAKENWLRRSLLLVFLWGSGVSLVEPAEIAAFFFFPPLTISTVPLVHPPCLCALCSTGACFRFLFLTGAGGAGFWTPLGCLRPVPTCCTACAKSSSALPASSSLPGWACHRCRVKSPRATLGHACHKPGPLCTFHLSSVSAGTCGSGFAGEGNIPRALRWGRERERSRMGLVAQRSGAFLAPCPTALGSEGAPHCRARQLFAAGCHNLSGSAGELQVCSE